MNRNDLNVCNSFPAFYWVVANGTDCDGFNSGRVYPFRTYNEADNFRKELQKGSDGIVYDTLCSTIELSNYCNSFDLDYTNYLTVYA